MILTLLLSLCPPQEPGLSEPLTPVQAAQFEAARLESARTVWFKLSDELPADAIEGRLNGRSPEVGAVSALLSGYDVEPAFQQSTAELAELRQRGLERGAWPAPPDLSQWFAVSTADPTQADRLLDALTGMPGVEHAHRKPAPAKPPVDIPPTTPNWTAQQDYFDAPTTGTNMYAVQGVLGATGSTVRMTDCEYSWVYDHEDLELTSARWVGGTPIGIWSDHGTAVLGQVYGQDNAYGVTGGTPDCDPYMATEYATTWGFNPTQAIINAAAASSSGDVILLEMQTFGPNNQYCPEEWTQASFDAISNATAAGIHVVEAGGNGGQDLDNAIFQGKFDVNVRDSRAIIVGAGTAGSQHTKLSFTSRGSRVDCQGWGTAIYTAGYGSLFQAGGDDRQDYTAGFGGTSGASPIVTSAVVSLIGTMRAHGMTLPTPVQVRDALRVTGTPQPPGDAATGRIGPLPDMEELFDWFSIPTGLIHVPKAGLGDTVTFNLSGNPGESWNLYYALDTQIQQTPQGVRVLGNKKFTNFASGSLNGAGVGSSSGSVPNKAGLLGRSVYIQAQFANSRWSNGGELRIR